MNKATASIVILLALTGCEVQYEPPVGYVCRTGRFACELHKMVKLICEVPEKAKFILDCAKAANPMSDEEGEDLVIQCERTATSLFCKMEEKP